MQTNAFPKKFKKYADGGFEHMVGLLAGTTKKVCLGFEDCNSHVLLYCH
jgi:hypothetical protein